jgi:Zn-dependent protease with chaperone function
MNTINAMDYRHPEDAAALENLQQIPGFAVALKSFMKFWDERIIQGMNMANKVRLGPDQLPRLYALLPPICQVLGIAEPELYLEMDVAPNAYTTGDTVISITVTTGLLSLLDEQMLTAALAHECGHIACRHVLYHTMGQYLLRAGRDLLGLGLLVQPLQLAFLQWVRCAELSCDRAAALYMQSPEPMQYALMRLAGGNTAEYGEVTLAAYMQQAKKHEDALTKSGWDRLLQLYAVSGFDHPFLAERVNQLDTWCREAPFQRIVSFMNSEGDRCPSCGAEAQPEWRFCKRCGKPIAARLEER